MSKNILSEGAFLMHFNIAFSHLKTFLKAFYVLVIYLFIFE